MITKEIFEKLFPTKGLDPQEYNLVKHREKLIDALNEFLPKYEINTYRRVCAFLACCGVETDYFKTSIEYASGADYEGRKDLGNTQKGDGKRFRGRGIIQTTGRYNYTRVQGRIGERMGIDVVKNPALLALPHIAVESACIFWHENALNAYADQKRFKELNGIVNRGNPNKTPLHWAKRNELYSKCIRYIPQNFKFEQETENSDPDYQALPIVAGTADTTGGRTTQAVEGFKFDLSSVKQNYNRATATLQNPSIKTVLQRAGVRIGAAVPWLAGVWATTSGKIAISLSVLAILGVAGGAIYSYRDQIRLGVQIVTASIKKTLKVDAA